MDIRKGHTAQLEIEKVVYGGRGLARLNNRAIFVDQTAPGDKVTAKIVRVRKDFAEARVLEFIETSPDRTIAPCPYSGHCGGCTWQFISYEKQLEYKHAFVQDSLNRIGRLTDFKPHSVLGASEIFEYRNKMEFSFSDRRWLLPQDRGERTESFALGLHVPGSFDKIVDIERCLLQRERGNEILREVRRYVKDSGIPVYGLRSHQGFWRYLVVRHSHFFDEWMVNIVTSGEKPPPVQALASILMERYREITSIVNNINTRKGGTAVGDWERILGGERTIREKLAGLTFEISGNSFFQTNTPMAERLYQLARDFASLTGRETVLDLYCGIGTVSILLASQARRAIGVDISTSALADARRNCELNGVDNCEFLYGDVKTVLSQVTIEPELLVTDPPRIGMHKRVIDQILRLLPRKIIYISCNPATFARDVAFLKDRYTLEEVQPIDLFPNTYHIELIARLGRVW
jgi:23S rRNA (uracil1939-C5)-methyltransferase